MSRRWSPRVSSVFLTPSTPTAASPETDVSLPLRAVRIFESFGAELQNAVGQRFEHKARAMRRPRQSAGDRLPLAADTNQRSHPTDVSELRKVAAERVAEPVHRCGE